MPVGTAVAAVANPNALAQELRSALDSTDALGMLYAETYATRRDNLPHDTNAACLLGRDAPGCEGLCAQAVVEVREDLVAYYRRQVASGRIGPLDNPGGYARTIVRLRHRDVVCALTRPNGGYARPERLARPTRPAYLDLDEVDGRILASAIAFLRSGLSPTDLEQVGASCEQACVRAGIAIATGEGLLRLERIIATSQAGNARAATFVQREILDLLAARRVELHGDIEVAQDDRRDRDGRTDDVEDLVTDAVTLQDLIEQVQRRLASYGGWGPAPQSARERALRDLRDDWTAAELRVAVEALDELLGSA